MTRDRCPEGQVTAAEQPQPRERRAGDGSQKT